MNQLDPLDAAMMTGELVSNPMHAGVVLILSPPEDAGPGYVDELYREALTGNDSIDPRLRRYPHRGVDTGGMWVWRDDGNVDLSKHCQRRTVSSGPDEFWRLIGELDAERLDRSRPMWMSYLIDGLEDGRFAFYIKVHHTVIDGVAGLRMITDALSSDSTCRSMPPFYADRRHESPPPPRSSRARWRSAARRPWCPGHWPRQSARDAEHRPRGRARSPRRGRQRTQGHQGGRESRET